MKYEEVMDLIGTIEEQIEDAKRQLDNAEGLIRAIKENF